MCLTLDYLFHRCQWKNSFTFKGGTSLSKCYKLIKRFSEDIDLILDWRVLGYDINEPWKERTTTKQDRFNKDANHRAEFFLREKFLPVLKTDMAEILGNTADIYIEETDPQTVCFRYPSVLHAESILQIIRLEIGALAAWSPANEKAIKPYLAEYYPQTFRQIETEVLTVAAERTFGKKLQFFITKLIVLSISQYRRDIPATTTISIAFLI